MANQYFCFAKVLICFIGRQLNYSIFHADLFILLKTYPLSPTFILLKQFIPQKSNDRHFYKTIWERSISQLVP